jgi:hypothetical protein
VSFVAAKPFASFVVNSNASVHPITAPPPTIIDVELQPLWRWRARSRRGAYRHHLELAQLQILAGNVNAAWWGAGRGAAGRAGCTYLRWLEFARDLDPLADEPGKD